MTDSEDAIDNYLVWQMCKNQEDIQRKISESSLHEEELKEIIEKVRQKYQEKDYDYSEKLRKLESDSRYLSSLFKNCSWKKQNVKVEDLGTTLPHLGYIPPEVISGTLPDVIEFVKEADPEEYQSVKYIMSLKEVPEVLNEFLPVVISPGSTIRELERMDNAHGEKDWDIKETWGAVHDANHRTIAKILANDSEKIECYVGRPKQ